MGGGWWVQMEITETFANAYHSLPKEKKFKIKQQILLNRKGLEQKIWYADVLKGEAKKTH